MMMPLPCWENCYHHPAIMIRVRKKVSFIFLLLLFFSILYPPHLWQVDRWNINKLKVKLNLFRKRKNHTKLVKNIHIYNEFLFNIFRMEYYYSHPIKSILLKTAKISYLPFSCFFFFVLEHFFFFCPTCYAFHIFISMEKLAGSFWAKPTHSIDDIISFCLSRTWEMYRYTLFLIQHNSVGCVSPSQIDNTKKKLKECHTIFIPALL